MPNLLIEIGTEELPLGALDVIYRDLGHCLEALLLESRIRSGKIEVEATPRRIAIFISDLAARQLDQKIEFTGPSYEKAYENGNPTKALDGFLKSKSASMDQVQIREIPKGRFVFVSKEEKGKLTKTLLPGLFQKLITPDQLMFQKSMRWEKNGFRFPRPIRWVIALLDNAILPLSLAGLKAGNTSRGHRFLSKQNFKIRTADWGLFQLLLRKNHVVLSLNERKEKIRSYVTKLRNQDEELIHLNAQLIEEPYFVEGRFSPEYLKLPPEVLVTVMKKHQKIFAIYDASGNMTSRFAAVLNGKRGNLNRIRSDFENVLDSRLKDARYFYLEDTKKPLAEKVETLRQIVYLGKLGSLWDKTSRLEALAEVFATVSGKNALKNDLKRAAHLSKADLMTHLVYEMPELQGIAGAEYAKVAGEKKEIAEALRSQYLPKNLFESYSTLPGLMGPLAAMLGILDRWDLLVGAFGSGLEPTGSQDPYALRRTGGVLVKLIRAFRFRFSLSPMFKEACHLYGTSLSLTGEKLESQLRSFLQDRILFELQAQPGSRTYEIAQAVFLSSFEDLADIFDRYEAMNRLFEKETPLFIKTVKVVERTANILKGSKGDFGEFQRELLQDPMEKRLFDVFEAKSKLVEDALAKKNYEEATRIFGQSFFEPINAFFDQVMVNVDDQEIRRNRQALMKKIHQLYAEKLADLSLLSRIEEQ